MSLEYILLGLLKTPATGYDLRATFQQSVRHIWSAELSQIYPTLDRLTRRGLLRRSIKRSRRGPARRLYALTANGRKELLRWLRLEPIVGTERFAYLAQLYFMSELNSTDEAARFMTQLRQKLLTWRRQLQAIEAEFTTSTGGAVERLPDEHYYQYLTLRMGLHTLSAKIAWCDETLKHLCIRKRRRRR